MSWKKILALALVLAALATAILIVDRNERGRQADAEGILLDMPAPAVERIALRNPTGRFVFARRDASWFLEEPQATKADKAVVEGILDNFCRLKYDRLVAKNAAQLSDFGLDRPEIEISLQAKGRPAATVLLGMKNAIDDSSYAKLDKGGSVVSIASYKRHDLEKDLFAFRDKKVAEIDAAAVDALEFKREGTAISLVKKDGRWFLRAPLFSLAKESKLNDLLSAASTLEALSFTPLPDKNGRGEFGIDPPLLVAEFRSPSGTRRITVGRKGEQHYALADGASEICGIAGDFLDRFDAAARAWRETKVASFFAYDVREIDFRQGALAFTARKNKDGAWELAKPLPGKRADPDKIERLLTALADLDAGEFVDGAKSLPPFPTRIALKTADPADPGKTGTTVIELSAAAGGTATARNPLLPYQFTVGAEILSKLPARIDDICVAEAKPPESAR